MSDVVNRLDAVLLDVDGTLVDSNDAHARAWQEALAQYGHKVPLLKVRRAIGMGSDKLIPAVSNLDANDPVAEQIGTVRRAIFTELYLPRLRPMPGARTLLSRMRAEGLKLVVASSAQDKELRALLDIAEVSDLIQHTTSSDDVQRSKPDPDVIQVALAKAGASPSRVIMIGDTPYDIEAARRAGVSTIAVCCGGWTRTELVGAVAVYEDPADIYMQYDASPLK